jgi:DNA-binding NarL/FixJ family response regulator
VSPKTSAARPGGQSQPSAAPPGRPQLVFARDDAAGSDERPDTSERILVVEDDFLVAMQMESALVEAGFEVAGVAATGEDAIELAISERPHLVVMDIRLAGDRDGIDTALQLFAEQGLRCIFATAHHDEQSRRRAAPADPLGWLHKPYTMVSLVGMVRSALAELGKARG